MTTFILSTINFTCEILHFRKIYISKRIISFIKSYFSSPNCHRLLVYTSIWIAAKIPHWSNSVKQIIFLFRSNSVNVQIFSKFLTFPLPVPHFITVHANEPLLVSSRKMNRRMYHHISGYLILYLLTRYLDSCFLFPHLISSIAHLLTTRCGE